MVLFLVMSPPVLSSSVELTSRSDAFSSRVDPSPGRFPAGPLFFLSVVLIIGTSMILRPRSRDQSALQC